MIKFLLIITAIILSAVFYVCYSLCKEEKEEQEKEQYEQFGNIAGKRG